MIPTSWTLAVGITLFAIGLYGALTRRHPMAALVGAYLMLNAAIVNLAAFSTPSGTSLSTLLYAVLAAQIALGLTLAVRLWRRRRDGGYEGHERYVPPTEEIQKPPEE